MLYSNVFLLLFTVHLVRATQEEIMAKWYSKYPKSHKQFIKDLRKKVQINTTKVVRAMNKVDRKFYLKMNPYLDVPERIGFSALVRTPSMCVILLETFKDQLKLGNRALDLSCGSGYFTVLLALMVGKKGMAVGVEEFVDKFNYAKDNVEKHLPTLLKEDRVKFVDKDQMTEVYKRGPYDFIYYGYMSDDSKMEIVEWLEALKDGGKLVIPILGARGRPDLMVYFRHEKGNTTKELINTPQNKFIKLSKEKNKKVK